MRQNNQSNDKDSKIAQDLKAYRIGMKLDGVWGQLSATKAFRNLMLSKEFLGALGSPYVSMMHLGLMTNAKTSEYATHIQNFIASSDFEFLVHSQAMHHLVDDCEVAKILKSFKVFKVKEEPKKSETADDSQVHIDSFKKHKKVLFSFLIYNLFRDSVMSNTVLQTPTFRQLYESEEADELARSRVAQELTHLVYNGETTGLIQLLLQLLGSKQFRDLAESDEMYDFLNSRRVVDLLKSYLVSKTCAITAQDASVSQESESTEEEHEEPEPSEESVVDPCDVTDKLHIDTTSISSSSSSDEPSESSTEESESSTEESTEESESSSLAGSWVTKSIQCKSETVQSEQSASSKTESSSTSSTSSSSSSDESMVPPARCCNKRPFINEHGLVKKGGVMVLKATDVASIGAIISQLNGLASNPQLHSLLQSQPVKSLMESLAKAQANGKVGTALQADAQASQALQVVSKSLKSKNVKEIKTALTNNAERLNATINTLLSQKPAPVVAPSAPVAVGPPAPPAKPVAPVKTQSGAFIQGLYKSSFTHVIYRYFKEHADLKAYSRFIGKQATREQLKVWKCSDDSLAEFQQFVNWYCANYDKVSKAIRKSLASAFDDEDVDFTSDDLYVGFKRYITFADWIHFQRFIRWAGKGGQVADDVDSFRDWARHHAHDEEYSRSDFDDWKDTFSFRDFTDVVNFMRWKGSKKLYSEACQTCCL